MDWALVILGNNSREKGIIFLLIILCIWLLFFEGLSIPIKIVFSLRLLVSSSEGQLTVVIKLLDLKTSDDEYKNIGAGVAGLQAIATAKRLGAIVSATDVRAASKEQVESLGGKFLTVEQNEDMETAGGYAKEASNEYKKKQAEMMKEALKKNDIVICTALIPGKPAPRILTEDLVKLMKPGSIVYDLAAEQGGNSAFSEAGKINSVDGIKIIGVKSLMNSLPLTASSLYAKNLFSFIRNLYSKEKKDFNINLEDEIISKTLIKE